MTFVSYALADEVIGRASLNRELKTECADRIDTLLEAVASGALKGPSVQAELEELEARQAGLAKKLAALKEEPVRLHPNLAALYRRKVATLRWSIWPKTQARTAP
jgi:site-specific DNA recombinase